MADIRIDLDEEALWKVGETDEVQSATKSAADSIAARARTTAPVDTGAYRAGIVVERSSRQMKNGQSNAYVVLATDPKSAFIEFAHNNREGSWNLRTAAESLGLQFVKKGR